MGTQKWHLLDHLLDAIRHVGDVKFLHCGLYEAAHKVFKNHYRKTSKRRRSVMREVTSRQNFINSLNHHSRVESNNKTRQNRCKIYAVKQDSEKSLEYGRKTTLFDLLRITESKQKCSVAEYGYSKQVWTGSMVLTIGYDGMRVLYRLLSEKFQRRDVYPPAALHRALTIPASAYIRGMTVPTLKAKMIHNAVILEESDIRVLSFAASCRFGHILWIKTGKL